MCMDIVVYKTKPMDMTIIQYYVCRMVICMHMHVFNAVSLAVYACMQNGICMHVFL